MQMLLPGTVVAVSVGPVDHVGILTDRQIDGLPTVISNSLRAAGVAEESLLTFGSGKQVRVIGFPGNLSPREVLQRARSRIGKPWSLLKWNCEHFVHWAHGLKPTSPQLAVAVALALLGIAAVWMYSRR